MHYKFKIALLLLSFEDFTMLVRSFSNSRTSAWMLSNCCLSKKSVSYSSSSQYSVSDASFSAMLILETKSALLCPRTASRTFAPMLVPLRSSCLERTNSRFSAHKYWYSLTIRTANRLLLSATTFSLFTRTTPIVHYALCIVNCKSLSR